MRLSILICTVPSRTTKYLPRIIKALRLQEKPGVEILWLGDNKRRTVGQKRNDLLSLAQGRYVAFVDDDDTIAPNYVESLLRGIRGGADVVNFLLECSVDGSPRKKVYYDARFPRNRNLPDRYERLPNHIMCIKRDLATQVGFPKKNMGEDDDFAARLRPMIKTQTFIDEVLYFYDFSHQTSETQ